MNDWVSNIKNLCNSRFQRIVVISVVRNKFTVIALNKNIKIQLISNLRSEVHLLSIECQSKIILKSESVEEISLHNDFLLDLGEPNLLIMIVIFSILYNRFCKILISREKLLNLTTLVVVAPEPYHWFFRTSILNSCKGIIQTLYYKDL